MLKELDHIVNFKLTSMKLAKHLLLLLPLVVCLGGVSASKALKFGQGNLYHITLLEGRTSCTLHPLYRSNTTAGAVTVTPPATLYYSKDTRGICINPLPLSATVYQALID
jgi:hypothetical protein